MQTIFRCWFGIALLVVTEVCGQETDPRVKLVLPPGQPAQAPKSGTNESTNAKIEASKGSRTLPPGLNTTQMVAEQFKASGTLRPYQPVNPATGSTGTYVPATSSKSAQAKTAPSTGSNPAELRAGVKNLKSKSGPGSIPGYEQPGDPFGTSGRKILAGSANTPPNQTQSSNVSLANQLPTNFPGAPGSGAVQSNGTTRVANGSQGNNQYDKVPYLLPANQYNAPPVTGVGNPSANQYHAPPITGAQGVGSGTNHTYGPPPNAGGQQNGYGPPPNNLRANNSYGTLPLGPAPGQSNNAYGPPPNTGGQQNGYGPPPNNLRANNSYGTLPLGPAPGQSNNAYGPPPNAVGQSNTYGAPPNTGGQQNGYGPPPNNLRANNSYGTLPLAPAPGQSNNAYGPPPNAGTQSNTYSAPPNAGGQSKNSQGQTNQALPSSTYGPAPPLPSQNGQTVTSSNPGGYTKPPPPAQQDQSAGQVNQAKGPSANPKLLKRTEKGGAIKVSQKPGVPGKQ